MTAIIGRDAPGQRSGQPGHRAASPVPRSRGKLNIAGIAGSVFLAIWALLILIPLAWVLLASFKNTTEIFSAPWSLPDHLRWENWGRAWTKANVGRYFLNSVLVVSFATAGTMLLSSMAAYVLARYKFVGNRLIFFLFVAGIAFPPFLAVVPLFFQVKQLGLLNSYTGLIIVYIAYSLPFTIFFLTSFFRTLPNTVAEAATIDGASHTRLFFSVMLPMAKPGLISLTIFNLIGQWGQYLLPLVLMAGAEDKWVLTQGIQDISTSAGYEADWSGLFAALTISILPMVVMYVIFQRQIQAGLTAGAVK
ncbi:carbohydrate ABC transporter permease [Dactylosporangium sp. AC04546]|uniref:carbohydrate ABC transporter permease n=1 Tax=Dactylosporangium sp. AC04546 TaxID=2862460 RepID=UPI001EDECC75|nr:carbohydrate ABC transporter permease [Dactylosporangium sp. AC04546]WVK85685.1 carbohydrate ABC transporter permease [Dactylosporangium sp. AC04546]